MADRNGNNRNAYGLIDAVVFFENKQGRVIVAPDARHPTPQDYERRECRTLAEVDKLTRRLQQQDKQSFDDLCAKDRAIMQERRDQTRAKLRQRMLAVDCTAFERRFIQGALDYLQKKEDALYKFTVNSYFNARENDHDEPNLAPVRSLVPKMSDRLASMLTR